MTPKSSESEAREREVIRLCILYAGVPGSFVLSWLTYFDKHGADLRNLFTRDTFVTFAVNLLFFGLGTGYLVGRVLAAADRRMRGE
jgi:hypothetical protein